MIVRMLPLIRLATLMTLAVCVSHGCGDNSEVERPAAAVPALPNEIAQPITVTEPTPLAQPTATPHRTVAVEEVTRPFNPDQDCPKIGPAPGTSVAQRSSATPVGEAGEDGTVEPDPLDAIVQVNQYRPDEGRERTRVSSGVVLSEASYVATVLDYSQPLGCPEVVLRNGTTLPARVISIHQMSGAAILEVSGSDLPQGVSELARTVQSETAVHIYHGTPGGPFVALKGVATVAGSDTLWILAKSTGPSVGDPIFDTEGGYFGLVVHGNGGKGALPDLTPGGAPKPKPYTELSGPHVAMSAPALMQLAQGEPDDDLLSTPVVVRFFGASGGAKSPIGGDPAAIAEKVFGYLRALDVPAEVEGLGGSLSSILRNMKQLHFGFNLELLYPISQSLKASDGTLLGVARYFVLWWGLGAGKPDLILAGSSPDLITHAFEANGLEELWSHVRADRLTSYAPFQTHDSAGFPDEYPLRWSLTTDRETYSAGETVQVGLRVENVSPLPMEVHLPSPFRVESSAGSHEWEDEFVSDEEVETVSPGEVLILTTDWDQTDNRGRQVRVGTYHVSSTSYSAGSGVHATGTSFKIVK